MAKKIINRKNKPIKELKRRVTKKYNDIKLSYEEVYYLDEEVDENTGMVVQENFVPYYTKDQTSRNLKSLKNAYFIEKGAASPEEIINFRKKYQIAASVLSIILGFSKNTISNIENEGITSLPTGRLVKLCISDIKTLAHYINICAALGDDKKEELISRLQSI